MGIFIGDNNSKAREIKNAYIGIDGKARKVKQAYIGINNVAHKVKQIYVGDANGKARLVWSSGGYAYIKNLNNASYIVQADSSFSENSSKQLSTYFSYGGYLYKTGVGYCAVGAPSTKTWSTTIYSINDL